MFSVVTFFLLFGDFRAVPFFSFFHLKRHHLNCRYCDNEVVIFSYLWYLVCWASLERTVFSPICPPEGNALRPFVDKRVLPFLPVVFAGLYRYWSPPPAEAYPPQTPHNVWTSSSVQDVGNRLACSNLARRPSSNFISYTAPVSISILFYIKSRIFPCRLFVVPIKQCF